MLLNSQMKLEKTSKLDVYKNRQEIRQGGLMAL